MTAQDVETSVTTNSPSQDLFHLNDQISSQYAIPGIFLRAMKFMMADILV